MTTLEELLHMKVGVKLKNGDDVTITPEFRAVARIIDGQTQLMIHANGYDSTTLDFIVDGNTLTRINGK